MGSPVISVIVVTHNHERFIAEALDGVLGQRLDVPLEIVIGEGRVDGPDARES
jgi:glycosyltransferase involved in cell wall biosynthesis